MSSSAAPPSSSGSFDTRCILEPGPVTAAEICHQVGKGVLPEGLPIRPAESTKELALNLAYSVKGLEVPDTLWPQATQSWQIRFVLEMAPAADLRPTPQQLSALIPDRRRLRGHLKSGGLHPSRRSRFKTACADFHELFYYPKDWRSEYQETPLWAAFRGVPMKLQGDLREALVAYSHSPKDVVEHAVDYLDGQLDRRALSSDELSEIFRRVARAVFAPFLRESDLKARHLTEVFRQIQKKEPGVFAPKVEYVESERAFVNSSREDYQILVAKWLKPLLEKIWANDAQKEVIAEVQRVLELRR